MDWREGRRRRAWELKEQGWKQRDIAAALGAVIFARHIVAAHDGKELPWWRRWQ